MAEQPGACLVGAHNPRYMTDIFDKFPPVVRQVLRESRYDLCSWCFAGRMYDRGYDESLRDQDLRQIAMHVRSNMERQIEASQRLTSV